MTLSCLIVIATHLVRRKWPPDPIIIMVVIATHVIKRHNASVNDIHLFSRISAKWEQVEVLCVIRPLRWRSGSAWGWLRQTRMYPCMHNTITGKGSTTQ